MFSFGNNQSILGKLLDTDSKRQQVSAVKDIAPAAAAVAAAVFDSWHMIASLMAFCCISPDVSCSTCLFCSALMQSITVASQHKREQ